jgi:hypothetical protein
MPASLEQVEGFLAAKRLKYRRDADQIVTGFEAKRFRDEQDRAGIAIVIRLDEDGRYLELLAPGIYNSRGCRHPAALFQVLLDIAMRTKMIRFEHDPADGEIRCTIECPLEDGSLTERQFLRMLECLAESIDRWHPVIRRAMETGVVALDLPRPVAALQN